MMLFFKPTSHVTKADVAQSDLRNGLVAVSILGVDTHAEV